MSLNVLTVGEGPPLLLLHGFTGTAHSWSLQTAAWSARYRVIAPDLLGHGGSDAPADPGHYALGRQAAELADLLDLLEAAPADVVGYSMGARLALVLALEHPEHVSSLVLESPSAGIADPEARSARRLADESLADEIERDGTEAFVDRWEALPIFAGHATLAPEVALAQRHERLRHDPTGLAASLRGAGQGAMEPLHHRLAEIAAPTLVIAGALDEVGLERARAVGAGLPQVRTEFVSGAGHTPHLEAPDVVERLVLDHLSTYPTGKR